MSTSDFLTTQGLPDGELLGAVLMVLVPVGIAYLIAIVRDRRRRTAERRQASSVRATTYRDDLCMVTNCDGTRQHDLGNGWVVCTDCRDELEAGWAREQAVFDQDADVISLFDRRQAGGAA